MMVLNSQGLQKGAFLQGPRGSSSCSTQKYFRLPICTPVSRPSFEKCMNEAFVLLRVILVFMPWHIMTGHSTVDAIFEKSAYHPATSEPL